MKENRKSQHWDKVTKAILVIALSILLFAIFSPIIFTHNSILGTPDFSNTGQIGDTIGGILNPFIALVGVLLTFLAFYMQIKANEIQISQFEQSFNSEKQNRINNKKQDSLNKLSLLNADLLMIITDIKSKAENIKKYSSNLIEKPFLNNSLTRSPYRNYSRTLEIDRLGIFEGYKLFLSHKDKWITDFSNLYNLIDFLPELFSEIYQKSQKHDVEIFNEKMKIRNGLNDLMNKLSDYLNEARYEYGREKYLEQESTRLVNETINSYYSVVNGSYDQNSAPSTETDIEQINNVLYNFVEQAMKMRNETETLDIRLYPIIENISNLRKDIQLIKERSIEFGENMEIEYIRIAKDNNSISYINLLTELQSSLKEAIDEIIIEE
tara:strand:- start:979 stop:2121 length:1143 start_codon:yes stop_codon:yes gene_type:complete